MTGATRDEGLQTNDPGRRVHPESSLLQLRKGITGAVAVLVVVAVVDALRSSGADTRSPPAEAAPTETQAPGRGEAPPDSEQEDVAAEATLVPGFPANGATGSRSFLLDLRTGETTPLAKSLARGRNFAASPDGRRIAFVARGDELTPQVFVGRMDGARLRQVTHGPRGAAWPAWSPDGARIAYEDWGKGRRNLFVLDLATGESRQVTDESLGGGSQFTPDGSALVYTGGDSSYPELRTVPIAGGKSTLVIELDEGLTDAGDGSLSPDGSLVTFLAGGQLLPEATHCGPCRIVANADGTDKRLVRCYPSNPAGTWSPDGSRIVCQGGDRENRVVVVDMTTGHPFRVAKGSGAVWVDNHTLLVEG
jgi:Tol biopolymer transport system component